MSKTSTVFSNVQLCISCRVPSILLLFPPLADICLPSLLPLLFLAVATVVCGVCFVLWVLSGPGVLLTALLRGSSESIHSCGWWDGPQPGYGGGLQGVSWWQLYTRHPAQVRIHGQQTLDNNILVISSLTDFQFQLFLTMAATNNKFSISFSPLIIHRRGPWDKVMV